MLATVALAMTLAMLAAGQTQSVGSTTGSFTTHFANVAHNVLTASANVAGNLGTTFQGLTEKTGDAGHS